MYILILYLVNILSVIAFFVKNFHKIIEYVELLIGFI
ncbi:hypothetical protein JOE44_001539 [Chryseobacterium sp. PvR013]|jgi:hypothetical protein|nr:hypothetical protein [Chryseobacterium sp. PvR013]MDR6461538.1 hypothetical protein [Chryseobacterium sediminis]